MENEKANGVKNAIKTEREKRIYVAPAVDVRETVSEGTETASNRFKGVGQ